MTERIDVHHHFYAPEYNAMLAEGRGGLPGFAKNWTPETSLADMDGGEVKMALLSVAADAALPSHNSREHVMSSPRASSGCIRSDSVCLPRCRFRTLTRACKRSPDTLDVLGRRTASAC